MASLANDLIAVLREENSCYEYLVEIGNKKKQAVIKNDVELLKDISSKENAIVGRLQKHERQRISLVTALCDVLNVKDTSINLLELADIIREQPERDTLVELYNKLRETLSEMKEVNEQNKLLIANAIDFVDFSVNLIRSSLDPAGSVYDAQGEEIDDGKSLYDYKN